MIQILFVGLGNICRSPVAQAIFTGRVEQAGLSNSMTSDSAGTASYHIGSLPDRRMRQIAGSYGVNLTHKARKLSGDDFYNFDFILTMDEVNFEDVRNQSYRSSGFYFPEDRLFLFREFDPEPGDALSIPDPYYEDIAAFDETYLMIERCVTGFLEFLLQKNQVKQ